MSGHDLDQQARELLAAEYERDGKTGSAEHIRTQPLLPNKARAVRAIAAALRQQPAPAELSEVTRQLIERDRRGRTKYGTSLDRTDLSLPDWLQHMAEELLDAAGYALAAKRTAHQPAPVVDDARMARALEWVRTNAAFEFPHIREHLPAIEEAIAAYDPAGGARTVRAKGVQP